MLTFDFILILFKRLSNHIFWVHSFHQQRIQQHIITDIELTYQRVIFTLRFEHFPEFYRIRILIQHRYHDPFFIFPSSPGSATHLNKLTSHYLSESLSIPFSDCTEDHAFSRHVHSH